MKEEYLRLNKKTKTGTEKARTEMKEEKFYTHEEVKKKLGLK